jgi:glycosyltransferase involved in cell wall biosynthesis
MNILFLAPHPIYQDRGTAIAEDLLLMTLDRRQCRIDLVTYHEGKTIEYKNVSIHRIFKIPFVQNICPGFSWKKIVCDFFMFFKVLSLAIRNRYQVVHAVEESVFIALVLKFLFGIPYIYDMDSSLPQQLVEKHAAFAFFNPLLKFFETIAIRNSEVVVPVCDSLAEIVEKQNPKKVVTLRDVSLLKDMRKEYENSLRKELGTDGLIIMYVGNLEAYQGIDLLLNSFALTLSKIDKADLVIIGGSFNDIQRYKEKCLLLGISNKVHFLGPKPLEDLSEYLYQADILVSPRVKGNNTPMKIYSYLHSGRAVLATDLPTHTQVLSDRVAMLTAPSPEEFSKGLLCLIRDEHLRLKLGNAGEKLIEEKYSYESFKKELDSLYDWLAMRFSREGTAVENR